MSCLHCLGLATLRHCTWKHWSSIAKECVNCFLKWRLCATRSALIFGKRDRHGLHYRLPSFFRGCKKKKLKPVDWHFKLSLLEAALLWMSAHFSLFPLCHVLASIFICQVLCLCKWDGFWSWRLSRCLRPHAIKKTRLRWNRWHRCRSLHMGRCGSWQLGHSSFHQHPQLQRNFFAYQLVLICASYAGQFCP